MPDLLSRYRKRLESVRALHARAMRAGDMDKADKMLERIQTYAQVVDYLATGLMRIGGGDGTQRT
jgi:hypothetical protein